jgi:hypothetical protein
MANGDVTLTRREHRELLEHMETLKMHHTKRLDHKTQTVIEPSFPHDASVHEDGHTDDPMMTFCPQCNVLMALHRMTAIHETAHARSQKRKR